MDSSEAISALDVSPLPRFRVDKTLGAAFIGLCLSEAMLEPLNYSSLKHVGNILTAMYVFKRLQNGDNTHPLV